MDTRFDLLDFRIENLRPFRDSAISLTRPRTVLVGPNNAGKTSLLRLLDWLFNGLDLDNLEYPASRGDLDFLLPARRSRKRARRLTLRIAVHDGRSHDKFDCVNGVATLRASVRRTPEDKIFLKLGAARRGEQPISDPNAIELLTRLRESFEFIYVPAFRDAASRRFANLLRGVLTARVEEETLHRTQGGAPLPYRKIKKTLEDAGDVVEQAVRDVWPNISAELSKTLVNDGKVLVDRDVEGYVQWLASQLSLRISTGQHDAKTVLLSELGSGLQSQLYLAIERGRRENENAHMILAVEEPEAFLHPSQQRSVARTLLTASDATVLLSTHSHLIVEEATHDAVVVCRDQRFFEPDMQDATRSHIASALLKAEGAEMMFARSVLLVEGEGDQAFFEQVRRRLAALDETGACDDLVVVPLGGKKRSRPWIELLRSYEGQDRTPIAWMIVADADAATDLRKGFREAGAKWPQSVSNLAGQIPAARSNGPEEWRKAAKAFNRSTMPASATKARLRRTPVRLLDLDVESAALQNASAATVRKFAKLVGWSSTDRYQLMGWLGSIAPEATGNAKKKKSFRLGILGSMIPLRETSPELQQVIAHWLQNADMKLGAVKGLIADT